jgi:hypothetical protein
MQRGRRCRIPWLSGSILPVALVACTLAAHAHSGTPATPRRGTVDLAGMGEPASSRRTAPVRPDPIRTAPAPSRDGEFPVPLWVSVFAVALCGALGAFAADLITDGGKLDSPVKTDAGWVLGWPGKLMVGAVAALVTLMLNPPNHAWTTLIGTALGAGVGGQALLLGITARRQADTAEQHRDRAREHAQVVERAAQAQFAATEDAVLAAYRSAAGPSHKAADREAAGSDPFEGAVRSMFAQARRGLSAVVGPTSMWEQMRSILHRRLGDRDLDTRPLTEFADRRIRELVAADVGRHWPHLSPQMTPDELSGESTLASIVNEIDGRAT